MIKKRAIFELLAKQFETEEVKNYYLDMCEHIPDYIFTMPASTSGKYHNRSQCQRYGQLNHIFMFHSILEHRLRLKGNKEKFKTPAERDCMRCVPAFHDAVKCGWNGSTHTVAEHPVLAAKWVMETKVEHDIKPSWKKVIALMCESHSGEWNKNRKGEVIMSEPRNEREFFIHECDILSSRADLEWTVMEELKALLEEDAANGSSAQEQARTGGGKAPEDYVLHFGKHNGKTLGAIQTADPDYFSWLVKKMGKDPLKSILAKMTAQAAQT